MILGLVIALLATVLSTVLLGGLLRVIHASRRGKARATDVFQPFHDGQGGLSLGSFGLWMMLIFSTVLAMVLLTTGHGLLDWYREVASLSTQGASPENAPTLPPLPEGFGMAVGLLFAFTVFFGSVFAIGLGQVSVARQPVFSVLRDGITGTLKNLLPLLVLGFCGLLGAFVALVMVALVAGLAVGFLMMLQLHYLAGLLLFPIYGMFFLALYVVIFGAMHAIWQDVAGSEWQAESPS